MFLFNSRVQLDAAREPGAKEDIWTGDRGSNKRLEQAAWWEATWLVILFNY